MEEFNTDLHVHSPYSIGVSPNMTPENIAEGARQKGVDVMGTGDALHPEWLQLLKSKLHRTGDVYRLGSTKFIVTTEIEDSEGIHHLVLLPDMDAACALRSALHRYSPNIEHRWGGRPRVSIRGEQIAAICRDSDALVGPAHAFTPYKSVFREGRYESIAACYGAEAPHISFLELGLSADTEMADCIPELNRMTFISSSDAHSPAPDRLGREFVRLRMEEPSFDELTKALRREAGRGSVLNLGLNPRLGKYYLSFCSSCRRTLIVQYGSEFPQFDDFDIHISVPGPDEFSNLLKAIHVRKVICPACGKRLRLGVRDRVMMIGGMNSVSPDHRPPYRHMPPLLELLSVAHASSGSTVPVKRLYKRLVGTFGTEIDVLTDVSIDLINEIDPKLSAVVDAYRRGCVRYRPGGGGRYGHVLSIEEVVSS